MVGWVKTAASRIDSLSRVSLATFMLEANNVSSDVVLKNVSSDVVLKL